MVVHDWKFEDVDNILVAPWGGNRWGLGICYEVNRAIIISFHVVPQLKFAKHTFVLSAGSRSTLVCSVAAGYLSVCFHLCALVRDLHLFGSRLVRVVRVVLSSRSAFSLVHGFLVLVYVGLQFPSATYLDWPTLVSRCPTWVLARDGSGL
ncbi:hypothetical protein U1Q18_034569 [Sarracenia purpurea var. burkii]